MSKCLDLGTYKGMGGYFLILRSQVQILLGTPPCKTSLNPLYLGFLFSFFATKFAAIPHDKNLQFWHTLAQCAKLRGVIR